MKSQSDSLGFGIRGKISLYIRVMFYALAIVYFILLTIHFHLIYVWG